MNIQKKVGIRIKGLWQELELAQEALAFKAEVDKTYLNALENEKRMCH
jgi:DNA-binding XRE family transcriptional regulator